MDATQSFSIILAVITAITTALLTLGLFAFQNHISRSNQFKDKKADIAAAFAAKMCSSNEELFISCLDINGVFNGYEKDPSEALTASHMRQNSAINDMLKMLMRDGCEIDFVNTVDTWEINGGNLLLAYKDDVLNCHKALIRFNNILCTGSGRLEKDSLDKLLAINNEMLTYSQDISSKCLKTMTADDIKGI